MRGVPSLSNKQLSSSIGAYEIEQLSDPRLFLTAPIVPTNSIIPLPLCSSWTQGQPIMC
jgi:hypothetical protein